MPTNQRAGCSPGCSPLSGCLRGAGDPRLPCMQPPLTLPLPVGRPRCPRRAEPPALLQRRLWSPGESGVRACILTFGAIVLFARRRMPWNGVRPRAICTVRGRPTLRVQSLVVLAGEMRRRHCAARTAALQPRAADPYRPSHVMRAMVSGALWVSAERRSLTCQSESAPPHGAERSISVVQDRTGHVESVRPRRSLRSRFALRHGVEPVVRGHACGLWSSAMNTPRDCTLNVGRLRTAPMALGRTPFTDGLRRAKSTIAPKVRVQARSPDFRAGVKGSEKVSGVKRCQDDFPAGGTLGEPRLSIRSRSRQGASLHARKST
jgi:hypothetical protein